MDQATAQLIGEALEPLWADPRSWLHRIVESVAFIDARTIRRSRSFDLTVPGTAPQLDGKTVLPLALLSRRVLSELDVIDDRGQRLALMTSEQNGAVSSALLVGRAKDAGVNDDEFLSRIAELPTRVGGNLEIVEQELHRNGIDADVADLCRALATGFMVYVLCDTSPGVRTVIKAGYSEPLEVVKEGRLMPQRIGWEPLEVAFEVRGAGEASSYHFEILAPQGGALRDASLAVASMNQTEVPDTQSASVNRPGRLAHLHLTGIPRTSSGKAVVSLTRSRTNWVTSAVLAGWSTFVVLVVAGIIRERLATAVESSVALLLVISGASSAIIGRPPPHDLTGELQRGPRLFALGLAGASYAAAGGFVVGLSGAALAVTLIACATVALVCAVSLTRAWLSSY